MPRPIKYSKDHAHCCECGGLHETVSLTRGYCPPCYGEFQERAEFIMSKANDKALADVSRKVLAGLASNRGEPTSPQILDAAIAKLGGAQGFGELIAEGRMRASGKGLTPEEIAAGATSSPQLAFKYDELIARISLKNDEREEMEISNLSNDELLNTLKGLVQEVSKESEDFRKVLLSQILQEQPDLIHEAMNQAGVPLLEAEVQPPSAEDYADAGLDEKWED